MHHPEEFIGQELMVTRAANKSLEGLQGRITDESKKAFTITTRTGEEKKILKAGCGFTITGADGQSKAVDGDEIIQRPEDRIKSRR